MTTDAFSEDTARTTHTITLTALKMEKVTISGAYERLEILRTKVCECGGICDLLGSEDGDDGDDNDGFED